MIKTLQQKTPPALLTIESEDMGVIADYLTRASDGERVRTEQRRDNIVSEIQDDNSRIESIQRDIERYHEQIRENEREQTNIEHTLANMPAPRVITRDEAQADIQRALALPYIKSIAVKRIDDRVYIVAQTRENSLYTTLVKKYSRSERWYRAKAYQIPLPAYTIRIGTALQSTLAQNEKGLAIALADPNDIAHFLPWIHRYRHEPHPHWGTQSVDRRNGTGQYRAVCLGEFESVVSGAFRKSIADGLNELAIYLQSAGTPHAYVHKREDWALWLGKTEYNLAIVPSEKEQKVLETTSVEDEDENDNDRERDCGCMEDENGDSRCDDECECDCHSN